MSLRGMPLTILLTIAVTLGTPLTTMLLFRLSKNGWQRINWVWKAMLAMNPILKNLDPRLVTAIWVAGTCWALLLVGAGFILIDGPYESLMGYVAVPSLTGLAFAIHRFYHASVVSDTPQD